MIVCILAPELVEILLRFRSWLYAISADIAIGFLQISVAGEYRDVHRFLHLSINAEFWHMRFIRFPCGNTTDPFMLNG